MRDSGLKRQDMHIFQEKVLGPELNDIVTVILLLCEF